MHRMPWGPRSAGCRWYGLGVRFAGFVLPGSPVFLLSVPLTVVIRKERWAALRAGLPASGPASGLVVPSGCGCPGRWGPVLALQASALTAPCWCHPDSVWSAQSPRAVCTWVPGDHPRASSQQLQCLGGAGTAASAAAGGVRSRGGAGVVPAPGCRGRSAPGPRKDFISSEARTLGTKHLAISGTTCRTGEGSEVCSPRVSTLLTECSRVKSVK